MTNKFDQVTISPGGKRLAHLSGVDTVSVVNTVGKGCVLTLPDIDHWFRLAFSPESQLLMSSRGKGSITIFDLGAGSNAIVPCASNIEAVAFSPNGTLLAGASCEKLNLFSGRSWEVRQKQSIAARVVASSPDGRLLAVARPTKIDLLNITHGGTLYASLALDAVGTRLTFSSDGRRLLSQDQEISVPNNSPMVDFCISGNSVNYRSLDMFWLPPQSRVQSRWVLHGNVYTWAADNGNLQYIKFDSSMMSDAVNWAPGKAGEDKRERRRQVIDAESCSLKLHHSLLLIFSTAE
jgi:WD40 repeat protein